MLYVVCPLCCSHVEVPDSSDADERAQARHVAVCELCGLAFDYPRHAVIEEPQPAA
jgi:hypothetical protein